MTTRPFIHADFLLDNETARRLYHDYAADLPIIDYHCHLPPAQIADDHRFANLAELWLAGDHYKWRAMRTHGVDERYCTGDATHEEKFAKWAQTVPHLLRNPLYHWTHMELHRPFGIDTLLGPDTADDIWRQCNAMLATPEFSARGIMRQFDVVAVCTTDDPVDTLADHRRIARDETCEIQVWPTWRPDAALHIDRPDAFNRWLDALSAAANVDISRYADLLDALQQRMAHFADHGCRLSDHGLDTVYADDYADREIEQLFERVRGGGAVTPAEAGKFKSALLYELLRMNADQGWAQQLHIGAMRNCNTRMFARLGPDSGFDSIGDANYAAPLARLLDRLDQAGELAPTILYNLNPRDNAVLATMLGNFQDGVRPGKMQFGAAWWFLDQLDGMSAQLETLSQMGLLSRFVGMLTDSRAFLSYPRHDYFRRLLCNILGDDIERGLIPADDTLVGGMIKDIGYRNAAGYFGFDVPAIA